MALDIFRERWRRKRDIFRVGKVHNKDFEVPDGRPEADLPGEAVAERGAVRAGDRLQSAEQEETHFQVYSQPEGGEYAEQFLRDSHVDSLRLRLLPQSRVTIFQAKIIVQLRVQKRHC
jgi:hypothetical protein